MSQNATAQSVSPAAFCEKLYDVVAKKGKREFKTESERERDENYVFGWRTDKTTYTASLHGYTVVAEHVESKTFSSGSDSRSIFLSLEVRKESKVVLKAEMKGSTRVDQFTGSDERFAGTNFRDGNPWTITSGELTPELEALAKE